MMKSRKLAGMAALLAVMLCLAGQALAAGEIAEPALGPAVVSLKNVEDAAALYAGADGKSDVLMEYLCGALVTVQELTDGDMAKVFVGDDGVGLTGYMRKDELAYGAQAVRDVPGAWLYMDFDKVTPIYASCDENAEVIGWAETYSTYEARGQLDGWAQLCGEYIVRYHYPDSQMEHGFVRTDDAQVRIVSDLYAYLVPPVEGELTYEQAYERAIALALENPEWLTRLSDDQKTEEYLRGMCADVRLGYDPETGSAKWDVLFETGDGNNECNAVVSMEADGTLIDIWAGNG